MQFSQSQAKNDTKKKKKKTEMKLWYFCYLTVSGAIGLNGPTSLVTEGFKDLVIVTVFG